MGFKIIGSVINKRYRIISQIGVGGMSAVYLAENLHTHERVAVKILDKVIASDEKFIERFAREANIGLKLTHQNITKVLDFGKEEDSFYIIMEYVDGLNLRQFLKQYGKIQWEKALDIYKQVLSALSYAYTLGIVAHRDVKPENIMIDSKTNLIKVMDFGIAKVEGSTLTQSTFFFTPHYSAPEALIPSKYRFRMNASTDIFCLSVVYYEMVTGTLPFKGNTPVEIYENQLHYKPPILSTINPAVPVWLAEIIQKALLPNPHDRYQSPHEVLNDIHLMKTPIYKENYSEYQQKTKTIRQTQPSDSYQKINPKISYKHPPSSRNKKSNVAVIAVILSSVALLITLFVALNLPLMKLIPTNLSQKVVQINTNPEGATVTINGKLYGITPLDFKTKAGTYSIQLEKDGYKNQSETIVVDNKQEAQSPFIIKMTSTMHIPDLLFPSGGLTDIHPEFIWSDEENVQYYEFQLFDAAGIMVFSDQTSLSTYPLKNYNLEYNTQYAWQVRANINDRWGDYSQKKTFRTIENKAMENKYGMVSFKSEPEGAGLFIDGKQHGTTPINWIQLPPGSYMFELVLPGYFDWSEPYNLKAGEQKDFYAVLKKEEGAYVNVLFKSDPPGATIKIDGEVINRLTPTEESLVEGEHIVIFSKTGYFNEPKSFSLSSFQKTMTIEVTLKPDPNYEFTLTISSEPKEAVIYIDDIEKGKTDSKIKLKPGKYRIRIEKKGYTPHIQEITISGDFEISAILELLNEKQSTNPLFETSQCV